MSKWLKIKLGSACQISKGQQLNRIDLETAGDYPCINGGIEPSGYTDQWNTEGNTITISEGGNSCGYVNFLTTRFWSGGHCYSLLGIKESIDVKFLYHALKGRENLIMRLRVGSGLPNIQQKSIKEFEIEYPENKSEQTNIAAILSEADDTIQRTEQLIAKYERIKTGLMQDLLTCGVDEHMNIRSEGTHEFKDSPIGRIPKEWKLVKVIDLGAWKGGMTPSKSSKKYWYNGSNLWFSSKDISIDWLSQSTHKITDIAISETNLEVFPAAISMIFVFRSGILRHTFPIARCINSFSVNQDLKVLIPEESYSPNFLYQKFKSLEKYFLKVAVKAGTTVESVDGYVFFNTVIAIPELHEQDNICMTLGRLDDLLNLERSNLDKYKMNKTSLMQDLLTGKVRVDTLMGEPIESI